MTTIVITKNRAIQIHDANVALAEWQSTYVKKDGKKVLREAWVEYCWPSNMENAIKRLAQEFIADQELVISLKEFNSRYNEIITSIKNILYEEGAEV